MTPIQLQRRYFQKSKTFLYPLIAPVKTYFPWIDTHIALEGLFAVNDYRLLVSRNWHGTQDFRSFERERFISHPFYERHFALNPKRVVYVFNLTSHADDWEYFLEGRYSKLSIGLKRNIRDLYGASSPEWRLVESYLFPHKFFDQYAKLMYSEEDREEGFLQLLNVGELCSRFDPEKETLRNLV